MKNQLLTLCIIAFILPGLSVDAQDWSVSEGLMNFTYEDTQGIPPAVGPIIRRWEVGLGNPFTNTEFFTIGRYDFNLDYILRRNAMVINDQNLFVGIGEDNPQARLSINHISDYGGAKPAAHIGPWTGGSKGYLTVNQPAGDNNSHIARFRKDGASTVLINPGAHTYQLVVYGDMEAAGYYLSSDARLKTNFSQIPSAMEIIRRLQPKRYEFKSELQQKRNLPAGMQYGLLAQEVQKVVPELVKIYHDSGDEGKTDESSLAVNYTGLIPILIAGQQETQLQIQALIDQNRALTSKLEMLQEEITKLKK